MMPTPQPNREHSVVLPRSPEPRYNQYQTNVSRSDRRSYSPPAPQPQPQYASSSGQPQIVPRSSWTRVSPIQSRLNTMGGVNKITIHHEGWKVIDFDNWADTSERLRLVQKFHMGNERGWGDIGYHYIIDRYGRMIEGRPLIYQGAHVRNNNENNIGVMVLGNFEEQSPSIRQLGGLQASITYLMRRYRVPVNRVYTHKEINPTSCPGRNLQPTMVAMRHNGHLG